MLRKNDWEDELVWNLCGLINNYYFVLSEMCVYIYIYIYIYMLGCPFCRRFDNFFLVGFDVGFKVVIIKYV